MEKRQLDELILIYYTSTDVTVMIQWIPSVDLYITYITYIVTFNGMTCIIMVMGVKY